MEKNNQTSYMLPCPNCKELSLPCTDEDGLLTDWCDACDTSIFATSSTVNTNQWLPEYGPYE